VTGISAEQLIQRAKDLKPLLLEQARHADQIRQLPEQTLAALIDAQLFSIAAPQRYHGLEMDLDVLLAVAKEIGRGCASTAWVMSLLGTHNWMAGLFGERAQEEIFADRGYVLAPAVFAPSGSAVAVDGGYRINGRWRFASGSMHSNWFMVSAMVEDKQDKLVGMRVIALPLEDVTIEDTWHTSGMRGTGSHDIVIEDAFVPEHRTFPFEELLEGRAPGTQLSDNPMYRIPLVPYLSYTAAAPALGLGLGALDAYRDYLQERVSMAGEKQLDKPAAQIRLARADMELKAAEALLDSGVQRLLDCARRGDTFTVAQRAGFRAEACYVATMVKGVVDSLCEASGARSQFEDHPLQRFQRDINTLRGHIVFDLDNTMEMYGRVLLGFEPNQPLV
jgi:3-hydroxy-9,10-secoandrosta-1,3,5(10)-triene-9,17-dione monooxygenase